MDENTVKKEKNAYGLWFLGENIIWAYVTLASTFLLDIGIDPAIASAVLLGPKIWDAVNDTLFGFIVDRTRFKNGQKFLPWIRFGSCIIGPTILFMYAIPASMKNETVKAIWFIVAYFLMDGAYTLIDSPMFAMPTVMTSDMQVRTSLIAANRFSGIMGSIVATVLIPVIRPSIGWFWTALLFSVLGLVFMIPFLKIAVERRTAEQEKKEGYTLKDMFRYLANNRYLMISLLLIFVQGATSVESVLSLIAARNCLGGESMATALTAVALVPTFIMALFIPKLTRRFDKRTLILFGLHASLFGSLAMYFAGYHNFVLIAIFLVFKGVGVSFFLILSYMLTSDSVEYGTYQTGTRATGISFSLQTFTTKMKNAVIGSLSLFALGLFGYDSALGESIRQSEEVVRGIWTVYNLMPAAGCLFCIFVMTFFYRLSDRDVSIMVRCNSGEISREEAEDLLGKE